MPVSRLQYNWDNNYTKKEKRMILLTQETIDKINNITTGWIDAVVETKSHVPYQTMTLAQLAALNDAYDIEDELNKAPIDYYNYLIDEGVMWEGMEDFPVISVDGETLREVDGATFGFSPVYLMRGFAGSVEDNV